jgi:protease I
MKIACVLDSGFEDSEFQQPFDAFQQAGHEVIIVGLEAGRELRGKRGDVRVTADKGIGDVSDADFDALLIPGGYSPDHLRASEQMVMFTRAFFQDDRPVFSICHGPQLMITARVVENRRLTAWKTIQDDLRQLGSDVVDEEVVVDRNLVTSRQPSDMPAFIRESLAVMEKVPAST